MLVCVGHVDLLVVGRRATASVCWSPRLACGQAQAVSRRVSLMVELSAYQKQQAHSHVVFGPLCGSLRNPTEAYLALLFQILRARPDCVAKWLRELCFT